MIAAYSGHFACVALLLGVTDIDVNQRDYRGHTALMKAAIRGHDKCVELLLAAEGIDVNLQDKYDHTALTEAAMHGHTECVKLLLGVEGIETIHQDTNVLMLDALQKRIKCVELILSAGAIV